ncbi:MAG: response regulator transcription factor [Planctomycetota bacterium]|nr:response regulator transcription factor [Planctomycetota bacterium]
MDDNELVGEAVRTLMLSSERFVPVGHLTSADSLAEEVGRLKPALVVLDIDMPGRDPLEALSEISRAFPETRTVVFSGHARADLVERAVMCGAWGYVSKRDGERHLMEALEQVMKGEFALSPEPAAVFRGDALA